MSLSLNQIAFSIPAGQTQEFGLVADFYRLATFPSGLLISLNGGPANALTEGFSQQGTPGSGEVRLLRIENPTGGTLAGVFTHGTGEMALPGVTTLSGTIPLPSGASSAALQTTGNASLTALAAANTDTAKIVNLGATSGFTYTGCKSFSLINTGTGNVVVTVAGISGNIPEGYGVDFPTSKPFNILAPILISTGVGGSALISLTT